VIRLDTHVVIWLYAGEPDRFSRHARALLDSEQLIISPMVQLELTFLHEIGRLRVGGGDIVGDLQDRLGLRHSDQPFSAVVHASAGLSWTRDPFDRLIVGDALAASTAILTKDDAILRHCQLAQWESPSAKPRRR
jgi:PIN domain nuclease of toxin-antitoxin system